MCLREGADLWYKSHPATKYASVAGPLVLPPPEVDEGKKLQLKKIKEKASTGPMDKTTNWKSQYVRREQIPKPNCLKQTKIVSGDRIISRSGQAIRKTCQVVRAPHSHTCTPWEEQEESLGETHHAYAGSTCKIWPSVNERALKDKKIIDIPVSKSIAIYVLKLPACLYFHEDDLRANIRIRAIIMSLKPEWL